MARVLLIDEDRSLARAVRRACLERGIAVVVAETVSEGVRFLLRGRASAVIVDAALLRLPGAEQAKLFEAVAPGAPVVILVSEQVLPAERAGYETLGFQVFAKPVRVAELAARVETLTGPATFPPEGAS